MKTDPAASPRKQPQGLGRVSSAPLPAARSTSTQPMPQLGTPGRASVSEEDALPLDHLIGAGTVAGTSFEVYEAEMNQAPLAQHPRPDMALHARFITAPGERSWDWLLSSTRSEDSLLLDSAGLNSGQGSLAVAGSGSESSFELDPGVLARTESRTATQSTSPQASPDSERRASRTQSGSTGKVLQNGSLSN